MMRRRVIALVSGLGLSLMLANAVAASVPPPPPVYIDTLAKQLIPTQTESTFNHYLANFADDLTVTVDGKEIAAGKSAWVAAERHRLGKVDRFVVAFAEGYDAVLVIERYDDRSNLPSSPTMLFDPRYKARAVRYSVGPDHLVHAIQIVQTDGILQAPK